MLLECFENNLIDIIGHGHALMKRLKYVVCIPARGCCPPTWWRHQIETFSALLAICARNLPVTGEFPTQKPVTRSFDVFFDPRLNK